VGGIRPKRIPAPVIANSSPQALDFAHNAFHLAVTCGGAQIVIVEGIEQIG
jgi:hypothetical protein